MERRGAPRCRPLRHSQWEARSLRAKRSLPHLLTHLAPVAREITRKCRTSSIQRKMVARFRTARTDYPGTSGHHQTGSAEPAGPVPDYGGNQSRIVFLDGIITKGILPTTVVTELTKRKEKLERDVSKYSMRPSGPPHFPISLFQTSRLRAVNRLDLRCSASQTNAKLLVDKILSRLS